MAIFLSQEIMNILIGASQALLQESPSRKDASLDWRAMFLTANFALEFPAFYVYFDGNRPAQILSIFQLLIQISVFLLIECACCKLLPQFEPPLEDDDRTATILSLDFFIPRAVLLFGIAATSQGRGLSWIGSLHFMSIVGWLMARRFFSLMRMMTFVKRTMGPNLGVGCSSG